MPENGNKKPRYERAYIFAVAINDGEAKMREAPRTARFVSRWLKLRKEKIRGVLLLAEDARQLRSERRKPKKDIAAKNCLINLRVLKVLRLENTFIPSNAGYTN
ncbi:hypothetical protein AVEN_248214-1 [Araneus ventricosus]|uniref:Uncharacterized protein n=1 Tax=Araneus ventricosus TaxID=182803 RepID=A0A4Y2J7S6_ARAVE|nr:hypothetical protein AVEN_248214-1 [Araneus ventricosus]